MTVDTGKVTDRRTLRFASSSQVLADVDALIASDRAGTLRHTGNWTLGQALGHLAYWANVPYDGYPPDLKPPWFIKVFLKLRKNAYVHGKFLPAGVKIPGIPNGTKGIDVLPTDEGAARLRKAWQRLDAAPPATPNIIFGPMTHDEWKALNFRHAELHLSFFHAGK